MGETAIGSLIHPRGVRFAWFAYPWPHRGHLVGSLNTPARCPFSMFSIPWATPWPAYIKVVAVKPGRGVPDGLLVSPSRSVKAHISGDGHAKIASWRPCLFDCLRSFAKGKGAKKREILCGTCGGMLVALIALISLNFRSVKVMQIAFFAKFYRFENWAVFTSPAGRRTSCVCVRDGFCKRVFVTVFTSPESRRVHFLRVCS